VDPVSVALRADKPSIPPRLNVRCIMVTTLEDCNHFDNRVNLVFGGACSRVQF